MQSEILGMVEKPVRYIGGEWNQVVKPPRPGLARVGLAFPDSYEIGMSHLGMRLLYDLMNRQEDLAAERVFCPWVDMEQMLRRYRLPLVTLETRTPLGRLDVLGFSLQFEMEYTNVLTMLDLGGVPLHVRERRPEDPLVVAGGPCVFSPEPMADFIDAFVIGDGEEAFPAVVRRWMELRRQGGLGRRDMLVQLSQLTGIYVPSLYRTAPDPETGFEIVVGAEPAVAPFPVRRAVVDALDRYPFPADTIVPFGEIVHDRVSVEIARGCTEGCRFCQAGIIYRPVRERAPADIIRAVAGGLRSTGYDEVSLTSLSTADYSCITPLVRQLMDRFERERTALSVSSLRVYGLTGALAEQLARVRRTGFTIAPEAGTQRMRDLINKGITDADIELAARIAWSQGWSQLKLYFMIGLPTETDADVRGIAETGIRVAQLARTVGNRRAQVTVSASALIPKPHSTFQWEPMDAAPELRRKQRLILDTVRPHRNVRFKYHGVEEGIVECILSRGDRRLGRVIEAAWRRGARFDSWGDHFDFGRWMECLREAELDPQLFLRRIPLHGALPWDHIDSRVSKEFLIRDLHAGRREKFLPACEKPFIPRDPARPPKPLDHAKLVCYDCGLDCDLEAIRHERIAQRDSLALPGPEIEAAFLGAPAPPTPGAVQLRLPATAPSSAEAALELPAAAGGNGDDAVHRPLLAPVVHVAEPAEPAAPARRIRYRTRFAKLEDLRWLSHLDLMRTLQRAFKRAGVPVTYSQGYHPAPLMSFGPALAVGTEGAGEIFDFESAAELDTEDAARRLNACLPAHLCIRDIARLPEGAASLSKIIELGEYTAWINTERRKLDPEIFAPLEGFAFGDPRAHAQRITAFLDKSSFPVTRSGGKTVDIRPFVHDVEFLPNERHVRLWLRLGSNGQARPQEVLEALYGAPGDCFRIRREALLPARDPAPLPAPA